MIADFAGRPGTFTSPDNAFVAISRKARTMRDRALFTAEAFGFGLAVALMEWAPKALELQFVAAAIGALGLLGVTDHMVEARRPKLAQPLWVVLSSFRFFVAAAATAAALAAFYALIGRLMGVFIL